jgi:nucleotide-binding universal stress UspA family protein
VGIARDINAYVEHRQADALVVSGSSKSWLDGFFPKEVVQELDDLEQTWTQEAGNFIKPNLDKARDMLLRTGISPEKIDVNVVDGGRRLAKILLEEAQKRKAGTIVLGRGGMNDADDYAMGGTTRKIFNHAENMAVWVVP